MSDEPSGFGVYVHIPFCRRRCRHCDYISFESRERDIPAYLEALCREMALRAPGSPRSVASLYIGGGTPSLLGPAGIAFLLAACREHFHLGPDAEVTIEVNPESATAELLEAALANGVNRLSIGVIALNDYVLGLLGRLHTAETARAAFVLASGVGFRNISLDLLYGLPAQTTDDFIGGVREVVAWNPAHLSLYALTVVPGSGLYRALEERTLPLLSEAMVADMYSEASALLEAAGYRQYEICNFARPGFASVHNRITWEFAPCLGLGVGAQSYLDGWRLRNTTSLDEYLSILNSGRPARSLQRERRRVPPGELARDALIMGLRQSRGLDIEAYDRAYGTSLLADRREQIETLTRAGMVSIDGGCLRLSPRGLKFSSSVFRQFLASV